MNVDDVYKLVLYSTSKNLQQGYVSPSDFNLVINTAQNSYLDYLLGEYQRYQVKRPVAMVEFGQNERIRDSIAPLIYSVVMPVNSTTGIAAYPSDYEYVDAMWGQYGFYNIRFIQQDRQDSYIHSEIDPIATNPVYLLRQEGFQYYPVTIGNVRMSYVRNPPPIFWGYTEDGNGLPVYNSALSQQPIWSGTDILQVIVRALAIVGVNLQFATVQQYAEQIKQGGQ